MCKIVFIFENYCHNTDEIYSYEANSQLYTKADPILLIGLFVFRRLFWLHWGHLAWKTPRNHLFYRQTTVGIWQQDSTYQCPWWQRPIPPALSKLLEQIQQAFQLTPLLAEGYLSLDSHKAHHTNISPPAMPLSFCSAVTFSLVPFFWHCHP